jgi:hypothetical protein
MPETVESRGATSFQIVKLTNRRYYIELSKTMEKETGDKKKIFLKAVHGQEADIPDDAPGMAGFLTLMMSTLEHLAIAEALAEARHFTKDLAETKRLMEPKHEQ